MLVAPFASARTQHAACSSSPSVCKRQRTSGMSCRLPLRMVVPSPLVPASHHAAFVALISRDAMCCAVQLLIFVQLDSDTSQVTRDAQARSVQRPGPHLRKTCACAIHLTNHISRRLCQYHHMYSSRVLHLPSTCLCVVLCHHHRAPVTWSDSSTFFTFGLARALSQIWL